MADTAVADLLCSCVCSTGAQLPIGGGSRFRRHPQLLLPLHCCLRPPARGADLAARAGGCTQLLLQQGPAAETEPCLQGAHAALPTAAESGDASLRLKDVQGRDQGNYTCHVANEQGSSQGFLLLLLAVAYEDPLLTIAISSSWNYIVLTYRSQGYPEAKVHWLNHTGSDITKHSQTSQWNCGGGLLALNSHLTVEQMANLSYTFQLANPVLNQSITRTVTVTNNALQ
ncbi:CD276 protein, partial [Atractosteus spatula]|nr:CD276 protein [Atractosteus spatula]